LLDMVLRSGAKLNLQSSNGGTALIYAAVDERDEMVRLLLAFKPQLNPRDFREERFWYRQLVTAIRR
jgi:ankyrin repeat protein